MASGDDPPNSRLFILCGKGITEQAMRDSFSKYGTVEDVWIVKDRRTNEEKGVCYVKFSKTSEAAQAMEEMNGRFIEGQAKPLKIMIANSRREGSMRDPKEEEKTLRLFVIIPRHFTQDEVRTEFERFGDIDYVNVLKDKYSGENKGFAYVKYFRRVNAAKAFEECDRSFKPKFAEPQRGKERREEDFGRGWFERDDRGFKRGFDDDFSGGGFMNPSPVKDFFGLPHQGNNLMNRPMQTMPSMSSGGPGGPGGPVGGLGPLDMIDDYPHNNSLRLQIVAAIGLSQKYLSNLFNLVPGMEYCDLNETTGIAYARYTTPQCAAYARDKLDGFEYPIGSRLIVQFADCAQPSNLQMAANMGYDRPRDMRQPDVRQKAAMLLEKAGINPSSVMNAERGMERVPYCNIPLPLPHPLKPEDTEASERLFIVCQPSSVPEKVLRDAFCRFGNLIDVYLLSGRNYGYAKYATKESAMKAIQMLHGQNLMGQRIKVLEAEPPKNGGGEGPPKKARY